MAIFNPALPNRPDPEWLKQSHPISDIDADKSAGLAVKGLGDIFGMGVKGMDDINKKTIDEEIYAQVDSERDAHTDALTKGDIDQNLNLPRTAAQKGKPLQLLAEEEQRMPAEVEKIGNYATNLKAGMEAGNYSKTYYDGRLLSIAKNMRAKYPGYREYIDTQISQVTGINPANQYINDIIHDINTKSSARNSEANKLETFVKQNLEVPGLLALYQGHLQDPTKVPESKIWERIADRKVLNAQLDLGQKLAAGKATVSEADKKTALSNADALAADHADHGINVKMINANLGTPQNLLQFMQDANTGKVKITTQQAQAIGPQLKAEGVQVAEKYLTELHQKGIYGIIGPTEAGNRADAIKKRYAELGDLIYNEKWGLVAARANQLTARIQDAEYKVMTDPEIGQTMMFADIVKRHAGEQFLSKLSEGILKNGMDLKFNKYVEHNIFKIAAQPGAENGNVVVLKDIYDEAKKRAETKGLTHELPKVNDRIVTQSINILNDPSADPETRKNAALAMFHPNNQNFIARIAKDSYRTNGSQSPGRFHMFERLTTPEVTSSIEQIGDPELKAMYSNWVKETWGHELLQQEVKQLEKIALTPGTMIGWDGDNKRWTMKGENVKDSGAAISLKTKTPKRPGVFNPEQPEDVRSLNLLNSSMNSLKNVAKLEGMDPESYIISLMIDFGYDPTVGNQSIPSQMINSIKQDVLKNMYNNKSK